jgi:hypothetical protein
MPEQRDRQQRSVPLTNQASTAPTRRAAQTPAARSRGPPDRMPERRERHSRVRADIDDCARACPRARGSRGPRSPTRCGHECSASARSLRLGVWRRKASSGRLAARVATSLAFAVDEAQRSRAPLSRSLGAVDSGPARSIDGRIVGQAEFHARDGGTFSACSRPCRAGFVRAAISGSGLPPPPPPPPPPRCRVRAAVALMPARSQSAHDSWRRRRRPRRLRQRAPRLSAGMTVGPTEPRADALARRGDHAYRASSVSSGRARAFAHAPPGTSRPPPLRWPSSRSVSSTVGASRRTGVPALTERARRWREISVA